MDKLKRCSLSTRLYLGGKILIITNLIMLLFSLYLVKDGGYIHKLKVKLGIIEKSVEPDYWAVKGWENTMKQLEYKADIAFFGNSITYYGRFQENFKGKKIVNLGYPGDNLEGMMRRIEALKAVNPDKVFIMAGINGLKDMELTMFCEKYEFLIDSVRRALPNSHIYLQSILPISGHLEKRYGSNEKIRFANELIKKVANQRLCTYIDLHRLYAVNGEMPDSLTKDGIHLHDEAYSRWYDAERQYVYNN